MARTKAELLEALEIVEESATYNDHIKIRHAVTDLAQVVREVIEMIPEDPLAVLSDAIKADARARKRNKLKTVE